MNNFHIAPTEEDDTLEFYFIEGCDDGLVFPIHQVVVGEPNGYIITPVADREKSLSNRGWDGEGFFSTWSNDCRNKFTPCIQISNLKRYDQSNNRVGRVVSHDELFNLETRIGAAREDKSDEDGEEKQLKGIFQVVHSIQAVRSLSAILDI